MGKLMKHKTTGDISRDYKIHRQTVHYRILTLGLKPVDKVGRVRLWSAEQVRQIVKGKL